MSDSKPALPSLRKPQTKTSPSRLASWWNQQAAAIKFSMERLWFNPLSTWMTLAAIAIALSLPTGLNLMLKNLQSLTDSKREVPTMSLFLKQSVSEQQAKDLAELLSDLPEVSKVEVVTKEQALDDFRKITGFAETLETLGENPLPNVLILTPRLSLLSQQETTTEQFAEKLKKYSQIESVQIDVEWVERLKAILEIAQRVVLVVGLLLSLTVLLVVGNTIRLDIENRKDEIYVTRLLGATNQYIRRPFIYGGLWLGLFGGILSLVIVQLALLLLVPPVQHLSSLYGGEFTLKGVDTVMTLQILAASCALGMAGAWLAASQHLWKEQ